MQIFAFEVRQSSVEASEWWSLSLTAVLDCRLPWGGLLHLGQPALCSDRKQLERGWYKGKPEQEQCCRQQSDLNISLSHCQAVLP